MTRPRVAWTERLDELAAIIDAGGGYVAIAAHFGCSLDCAGYACRKYKRPHPDGIEARRAAHVQRLNTDPEILARRSDASRAMYTPELRAKRADHTRSRWQQADQRAAMIAGLKQTLAGNEPLRERRRKECAGLYKLSLAARQRRKDEAAALAEMTPFERKCWLVETGRARAYECAPIRRPDPQQTLGGVASYG